MNDQTKTLRDEFALAAMQAAATNPAGAEGFTFEQRAQWAYLQADAMLTARAAQTAPEPAPTATQHDACTPAWYAELLELLGATCQTDAKHLINELTAAKIDEAEARATVALYRALGVRDQEAALAKIKELTK